MMIRHFAYIFRTSYCKTNLCRQVGYLSGRHVHTVKGWKIAANPKLDLDVTHRSSDTYSCEEGQDAVQHKVLISKLNSCNTIREQIHTLSSTLSLSPEDLTNRQQFCDYLAELFRPFFSQLKVTTFGSSANTFGFKGSDVDVCIQTMFVPEDKIQYTKGDVPFPDAILNGNIDKSYVDSLYPKLQLRFLRRILRKHCKYTKEPIVFIKARCPIIRFYNHKYDLFCDLSCENKSALRNTRLLHFISHLDERVGLLVKALRYWGKQGKFVGDADMFNSYAFSMLVTYFLQNTNPPILPPLEYLLNTSEYLQRGEINDHDLLIRSVKDIPATKNKQHPEELLKEFFFFYTYLDFSRVMLPLTSSSVPRWEFQYDEDPPTELFEMGTVCIQDPFRRSFNTTSGLGYKSGKRFLNSLLEACKLYQDGSVWSPSACEHWGLSAILESTTENTTVIGVDDIFTIKLKSNFHTDAIDESEVLLKTSSLVKKLLEYSLLFNVKTRTAHDSTVPMVRFEIESTKITWVGRHRIRRELTTDETSEDILEAERQISLHLTKDSTNRQFVFAFLCECILSTEDRHPTVLLNINYLSDKCSPALVIFFKEYVPTMLRTLL